MTTPTFTPPPPAPQRLQDTPAQFVAKADAFVAWFATLFAELVAFLTWMVQQVTAVNEASQEAQAAETAILAALQGTNYIKQSTANLAVSAGVKAVTGLNGAAFANGDELVLVSRADARIRMWGALSNFNSGAGTGDVTVTATTFTGSGTLNAWQVFPRAFEGTPPDEARAFAIAASVI